MSMDFYYIKPETYNPNDLGTTVEGPNFSNANCGMILRSLGYTEFESAMEFDPDDLLGRCLVALATSPIADDGMPDVRHDNWTQCGVRPGYFAQAYSMIAEVAQAARDAGVSVFCA